jgi:hypothetical protein
VSGSRGGDQEWGTCSSGRERELGPMKRGNDNLGTVGGSRVREGAIAGGERVLGKAAQITGSGCHKWTLFQ